MTSLIASKKLADLEEVLRHQEKQIILLMKRVAQLERENLRRKRETDQLSRT